MADVRTLKLNLLADVDQFSRSLNTADNDTKSFSKKIGGYGKKMATAFAVAGVAAGAYAIKLGVDGVKSAIEDEASQKKLETALKNTTKATDKQVEATEDYISATQIRYGISDVKLRDSLGNLLRATGDVTEAQKLNNLAIDIAAATGRDLETVSLTLGKAYDGNFTSLRKLGVPLDENILKTKDFDLITKELTDTFGGSAQANTETFSGQLNILKERFGEIQEDIGAKLIPKLKDLLEQVNLVAKGFSGEDPEGLSNRARELAGEFEGNGATSLGGSLRALADSFGKLFTTVTDDGDETTTTLQTLAGALESIANGINSIADAYKKAKSIGGGILDFISIDPGEGPKFADSRIGQALGYTARAAGGSVMGGNAYRVGEFGPELFVPSGSGSIRADNGGGGVVINLNGIVDAESARRSIERLLQNSTRRTGALNFAGSQL
jgi:hypothetical protein